MTAGSPARLRFGDCVFDGSTREIFRREQAMAISPKAFALLGLLLEARPAAVSKADIHEKLWPGIHVSEANLPNLIVELRAALGDDARHPQIIRTVARFGYAFSADARPDRRHTDEASPRHIYRLVWGRREIALDPGENLIGRERDAVVWIDDESVSRRHARIVIGDDGAMLEDLGSKNGTSVGGRKIEKPTRLTEKDEIRIGPATMRLRVLSRTGSTLSSMKERPER